MGMLFRKIFEKSKEYVLLFVLLIISLIVLTQNSKPEVKNIRKYAFASFAIWAEILNSTISSDNSVQSDLQQENAKLVLEMNKLREHALENNELKALLKFKKESEYELVPAQIVSKNIAKTQGVYIINLGLEDNICKSMPVLNEIGLIGVITEVSQNYSLVQTINSSLLKISASIPRSNVQGVITWNGNDLVIQNVPTTADINKGDRVVTSVLSTIFPPSIPIGLVVDKRPNISGLLSEVLVKPFVDVYSAKNVFVLFATKSTQIDSLELNLMRR